MDATENKTGGFVYIDLIRMVSPYKVLKKQDFDFYMLGPFDAMKVITKVNNKPIQSISDLQSLHKRRYENVSAMFDRQPLYLYCRDNIKTGLFAKDDKPLVMTLFQLDDIKLRCEPSNSEESEVDCLISEFDNRIRDGINEINCKTMTYQVFYCMGESDVVVIFRDADVSSIGRLLFGMRIWEKAEKKLYIRVLSNSSYCAFPASQNLSRKVDNWLRNEKKAGTEFVTLTNTSFGLNSNFSENQKEFRYVKYLLGEWDHCLNWGIDSKKSAADEFLDSIDPLISPDAASSTLGFRASYTIPEVQLQDTDVKYASSGHHVSELYNDKYMDFNSDPYTSLREVVAKNHDLLNKVICSQYNDSIAQLTGTLHGLYNHLVRLLYGRFEGDLFSFLKPVFDTLASTTTNHVDLIQRYCDGIRYWKKKKKRDNIANLNKQLVFLLDDYVSDLSELLSEIQHLFSIISVSPYTYLETYGSNMRSIAAVCKLLAAYEGIVYSLSKNFGMTINKCPVTETFLVLPYRNVRVSTKNYFETASPKNRICRISIDFTKMFHIRYTLYVLLHECGHQLRCGSFREKRMFLYYNAAVASLLDSLIGDYYKNIKRCIGLAREPISKSVGDYGREYPIEDSLIKNYEHKIYSKIMNFCIDCAEYCHDKRWEDYKKVQETVSEPDSLELRLASHTEMALQGVFKEAWDFEKDKVNKRSALYSHISDLVKAIFNHYGDLSKEVLKSVKPDYDPFAWIYSGFEVDYNDKQARNKLDHAFTEDICKSMANRCDEFFTQMSDVFSEIYSDIFAFYMLGVSNEDSKRKEDLFRLYFQVIYETCGFHINEYLLSGEMLLRLCIVEEACAKEHVLEKCLASILDKKHKNMVLAKIRDVKNDASYVFVRKYADECCSEMENKLQTKELRKATEKIRELFYAVENEEAADITKSIHYFWKVSTQR